MRWWILALVFAARAGQGVQFQTMASVGDNVAAAFSLTYADIGLLIGLFMAPGFFLALPAGAAGRLFSDRLLGSFGLFALGVGSVLSAVAPDPVLLAVGRLVSGVGFIITQLYFTKMIADWFDGREIATAMSILVMSWPFGIAMGQVGHTWLAETYNWRVPFAVASVYCFLVATALFALYRPPFDQKARPTKQSSKLLPQEWALIFCAGIAWGVFNCGYIIFLSFGPEVLKAQGVGTLKAASIISAGSWVMIVSGAVCGQIADRFGMRGSIIVICTLSAIGSLWLLTLPGAGLAASLLFGILGIAPAGVIMAMAGQAVAPERRALGMGVFFMIYFACMTVSPVVAGWIFDATGDPQGTFILASFLFALVIPAAALFSKIKARQIH